MLEWQVFLCPVIQLKENSKHTRIKNTIATVGPFKRAPHIPYSSRLGTLAERDLFKVVFKKLHCLYKFCTEVELIPDQKKRENDSV